jgi:hypothetical protein
LLSSDEFSVGGPCLFEEIRQEDVDTGEDQGGDQISERSKRTIDAFLWRSYKEY